MPHSSSNRPHNIPPFPNPEPPTTNMIRPGAPPNTLSDPHKNSPMWSLPSPLRSAVWKRSWRVTSSGCSPMLWSNCLTPWGQRSGPVLFRSRKVIIEIGQGGYFRIGKGLGTGTILDASSIRHCTRAAYNRGLFLLSLFAILQHLAWSRNWVLLILLRRSVPASQWESSYPLRQYRLWSRMIVIQYRFAMKNSSAYGWYSVSLKHKVVSMGRGLKYEL